jgi:phospholipase/carboxylesterase
MSDAVVDDMVALLPPLLQSLESLGFVSRYLNPSDFGAVMEAAGTPDDELRAARPRLEAWPESFADVRTVLAASCDATLAAFDGLREVAGHEEGIRAAYRALRHVPRALEALYPLAARLPPVSTFFLDPPMRKDEALRAKLAAQPNDRTGVLHVDNDPGTRGGFSLYVPEYYTPDRVWPFVMAMHGGSGNGRAFLWSWLRDARSHGAILVAPTATGGTWALMGDDTDSPNLVRILDFVRSNWNIDSKRLLLTGMSDGGTFSYVSGLETASPFTHLGPVAASFHPMLAQMADDQRIARLPIYLVHGKLDWMFPVEMARQAEEALTAAGARVNYREIDDLSHTYPREVNAGMLRWPSRESEPATVPG